VLYPTLEDYTDGEKRFRDTVRSLATACKTTRGNIVSAIRIFRMEITHLPKFGTGEGALRKCNHLWGMRILVLTLEYNLTTGSRVPIVIGRFRKSTEERYPELKVRKLEEGREAQRPRGLRDSMMLA
jgi:hypothetical protein